MLPRSLLAIMIAAVTCAAAGLADASVMLRSAQLTSGGGSGFGQTTYSAPVPFPNDAANFAGAGPDGLEVRVNRMAHAHHHLGNQLVDGWAAETVEVAFQVHELELITYTMSTGA